MFLQVTLIISVPPEETFVSVNILKHGKFSLWELPVVHFHLVICLYGQRPAKTKSGLDWGPSHLQSSNTHDKWTEQFLIS